MQAIEEVAADFDHALDVVDQPVVGRIGDDGMPRLRPVRAGGERICAGALSDGVGLQIFRIDRTDDAIAIAARHQEDGNCAGHHQAMGARREVVWAVAERYGSARRREKGRILDELTATTGWHRKHAVRALSAAAASWKCRQHSDSIPMRRRPARSTTRHSERPVGGASTQMLAMH